MNRKTNRLESFTTVKPVPDAETATQTVPVFTLGPPPSISQTNEGARVGAVGAFSGQICIPINGQNPNHQTKVSLSTSIDILHFLSPPFSFFSLLFYKFIFMKRKKMREKWIHPISLSIFLSPHLLHKPSHYRHWLLICMPFRLHLPPLFSYSQISTRARTQRFRH